MNFERKKQPPATPPTKQSLAEQRTHALSIKSQMIMEVLDKYNKEYYGEFLEEFFQAVEEYQREDKLQRRREEAGQPQTHKEVVQQQHFHTEKSEIAQQAIPNPNYQSFDATLLWMQPQKPHYRFTSSDLLVSEVY